MTKRRFVHDTGSAPARHSSHRHRLAQAPLPAPSERAATIRYSADVTLVPSVGMVQIFAPSPPAPRCLNSQPLGFARFTHLLCCCRDGRCWLAGADLPLVLACALSKVKLLPLAPLPDLGAAACPCESQGRRVGSRRSEDVAISAVLGEEV